MAAAQQLQNQFTYKVIAGAFKDELVRIVDNRPFPDTDERRRTITVDCHGTTLYLLPRVIDPTPVLSETVAPVAPVAAPVAPVTPVAAPVAPVMEDAALVAAASAYVEANPITDPMDPRLDHLRPDPIKVRQYIRRQMPNGETDVDFLVKFATDALYRADNNGYPQAVALKGDTQAGKTHLVNVLAYAMAEKLGYPKPMPIFTLSGTAGVTDYQMFGQALPYTGADGQTIVVHVPGVVDRAVRCGGILYCDEVNAIAERYTTSLFPLLDFRHMYENLNKAVLVANGGGFATETCFAHKDLWVIATYNEGYRGMTAGNQAFLARFRHIEWGYDASVEKALIPSDTVRLLGEAVRTAREKGSLRSPVGTTALRGLWTDVQAQGVQMALAAFTAGFDATDRPLVRDIIKDRSIDVLLKAEMEALAQAQA
jgi:hypothetical protein